MRQLVLVVIFVIVVNIIGAVMRARAQKKEMERRRELAARSGAPMQGRIQGGDRAAREFTRVQTTARGGDGRAPVPLRGGPMDAGRPGLAPPRRLPSKDPRQQASGDRAFPAPRDVSAGRRDDALQRGATRPAGGVGAGGRMSGALDEEQLLAGRQAESARRTASRHRVDAENLQRNEQLAARDVAERVRRNAEALRVETARLGGVSQPSAPNAFDRAPFRRDAPDSPHLTPPHPTRSAEAVSAYAIVAGVVPHQALLAALRTPQGMRNAIILREILDPPPGLRGDPVGTRG